MATVTKINNSIYENDSSYRQAWVSILKQPAVQQLDPNAKDLLDNIAKIGYENANSKSTYKRYLFDYLSRWCEIMQSTDRFSCQDHYKAPIYWDQPISSKTFFHKAKNYPLLIKVDTQDFPRKTTVFVLHSAYTKDIPDNLSEKSLGRPSSMYMKRLIPLSYAICFAIFLSLSLVFSFTFYNGLHGGNFFIGPWANLMMIVAAVGLMTTVLVACGEWRRWQSEFPKRQKQT